MSSMESIASLNWQSDIPASAMPMEAIMIVKFIDENGMPQYGTLTTATLHLVEGMGMLEAAVIDFSGQLQDWIDHRNGPCTCDHDNDLDE